MIFPFFKKSVLNEKMLLSLFALFFYTSWIYESETLGIVDDGFLLIIKRCILLVLSAVLLCGLSFGKKPIFGWFEWLSIAWVILNIFEIYIHPVGANAYIHRSVQMVFCVIFLSSVNRGIIKPLDAGYLKLWVNIGVINTVVISMLVLYLMGWFHSEIANTGFGGSRAGFSIWLFQLVVLIFLLGKQSNNNEINYSLKNNLLTLSMIVPVYCLQNLTGGRTGVFATILAAMYFMGRKSGIKSALLSILVLGAISFVLSNFNPYGYEFSNLSIIRNIIQEVPQPLGACGGWLDRFSSCRVSLIETAFSGLSQKEWILGVGIGNFLGYAPSYPGLGSSEVHNVLLKILGEYGVFGFLIMIGLISLGFFDNKKYVSSDFFWIQLIYFAVSLVHPDLMFTSVGLSVVYLLAYSERDSVMVFVGRNI